VIAGGGSRPAHTCSSYPDPGDRTATGWPGRRAGTATRPAAPSWSLRAAHQLRADRDRVRLAPIAHARSVRDAPEHPGNTAAVRVAAIMRVDRGETHAMALPTTPTCYSKGSRDAGGERLALIHPSRAPGLARPPSRTDRSDHDRPRRPEPSLIDPSRTPRRIGHPRARLATITRPSSPRRRYPFEPHTTAAPTALAYESQRSPGARAGPGGDAARRTTHPDPVLSRMAGRVIGDTLNPWIR
jgi:hypothetical protein